ncbi:MAG: hypothetical protein NT027_10095 [Proteobacteria bacterium]|nr:hypothetical protein [Pseudomonadota bacterium]
MWHRISCSLFLLQTINQAFAGNISSGGGEFLGDTQNPWFLEATRNEPLSKPIRYCLEKGPDFIVQDRTLVTLVRSAIDWWDLQASSAVLPENLIQVGTQILKFFVKLQTDRFSLDLRCEDATDLKFQFDFTTQKQKDELQKIKIDLSRYVGVTIREDYTPQLRGKGYIYISPDRGPNAMRSPNIVPEIWSVDEKNGHQILLAILKHELGHVHGIPHTQTGLMDAKIPERLTSNLTWDADLYTAMRSPVFFPGPANVESCNRDKEPLPFKYFNIPESHKCVGIYIDLSGAKVWQRLTETGSDQEFLAKVSFNQGYLRRQRNLIHLALPSTRDVYRDVPEFTSRLKGPSITEIQLNFKVNVHGVERAVSIQNEPNWFQISGALDGQMIPDLFPSKSGWRQ